ncbi:MAG: haloacid dehalogenase type II [Spiribacter sp.]|jgi:2-haloacid dehalogenase|nr:haloacid dehalogenase type II [Spiribacter sp.]MDR9489770.1 haloacid dehalogenase type II [Spiribacter sp.]
MAPILVFDVNETLLDLSTLEPFFVRCFGDQNAMRDWFAELILYAQTMTLSRRYWPFNELALATLRMRAEISGIAITQADEQALAEAIRSMPACPDVMPGLERLKAAGFRLVTLTNSPPSASPTALEHAGIADYFEAHYSVDSVAQFKPAEACYAQVASALNVATRDLCLVACHGWDTIGAQAAGCQAAFIRRHGNAEIRLNGLPRPDVIAADIAQLADQLI